MVIHRSGAIYASPALRVQLGFRDKYAIEFAISHGRKLAELKAVCATFSVRIGFLITTS
jgi:hypothetical protein